MNERKEWSEMSSRRRVKGREKSNELRVTNAPLNPTPSRMLSMGPPKQAEKAMMGAKEAMERLATRSAVEFPMAKTRQSKMKRNSGRL